MFNDDWTPAHLTHKPTNLYKEIALALKGSEWRQPGLVALASKLASSAESHDPIDFTVPDSYKAKTGPNPHRASRIVAQLDAALKATKSARSKPRTFRPHRSHKHDDVLSQCDN